MVERPEPFGGSDCQEGLLSGLVSCVSPLALQRYASKQSPEFHLAFGACRLDEWCDFSHAKFLTDSLDSTSLHRGYAC